MIYFVACPSASAVKIGYAAKRSYLSDAATAFERMSLLQTGCPFELELLAICPGDRAAEAALHERFSDARIRGEWFAITPEIRAHVALLEKPKRAPRGWHGQARNRAKAA
jgi:hypothetical protein